jgi:hypothetical protein
MQVPCDMEMLASMSDLEVLVKLMGATSKETIIVNVRKCLVPYLDRLEELETGARKDLLQNYLLHCSATSLVLPFEVTFDFYPFLWLPNVKTTYLRN